MTKNVMIKGLFIVVVVVVVVVIKCWDKPENF